MQAQAGIQAIDLDLLAASQLAVFQVVGHMLLKKRLGSADNVFNAGVAGCHCVIGCQ